MNLIGGKSSAAYEQFCENINKNYILSENERKDICDNVCKLAQEDKDTFCKYCRNNDTSCKKYRDIEDYKKYIKTGNYHEDVILMRDHNDLYSKLTWDVLEKYFNTYGIQQVDIIVSLLYNFPTETEYECAKLFLSEENSND